MEPEPSSSINFINESRKGRIKHLEKEIRNLKKKRRFLIISLLLYERQKLQFLSDYRDIYIFSTEIMRFRQYIKESLQKIIALEKEYLCITTKK